MPWRLTEVSPLPGFRLRVTFVDGTSGEVELERLLQRPDIEKTVFAPLRDAAMFNQATVVLGAVTWPGGADLAPDAMYDAIRDQGRWVLE
ncbi:MAG TPA: DUF2442 domain-containing protein [Thermoanaerobaculia bacterium]|nr:DUF2442 domain-containing protein [Thermoanaerobaculia bacterium]HXT50282.1 DUF2442 domain-containing protein [Thermoanaerobaculia bacterium]